MTLKRSHAIGVLLLGLFGLLFLDLLFSAPIDPFQAPPPWLLAQEPKPLVDSVQRLWNKEIPSETYFDMEV